MLNRTEGCSPRVRPAKYLEPMSTGRRLTFCSRLSYCTYSFIHHHQRVWKTATENVENSTMRPVVPQISIISGGTGSSPQASSTRTSGNSSNNSSPLAHDENDFSHYSQPAVSRVPSPSRGAPHPATSHTFQNCQTKGSSDFLLESDNTDENITKI